MYLKFMDDIRMLDVEDWFIQGNVEFSLKAFRVIFLEDAFFLKI